MNNKPDLFSSFIAEKKAKYGALKDDYSSEQLSVISAPNASSGVVVACPGAGKTKVLLDRVENLLKAGATSKEILLITFTKEASLQFKQRLQRKLIKDIPLCSTVHALAYKIIHQKLKNPPDMINENQMAEVLTAVRGVDAYLKNLSDDEILLEINKRREAYDATGWSEIVCEYEKRLSALGVYDFTSLLKEALPLVTKPLFKYVYVDEFQDLSDLQYSFIQKIIKEHVWFVGDPDQSIYSFKGSSERVLENLTNGAYPIFNLTNNYRGCKKIVEAANKVICQNIGHRKSVKSALSCEGSVVEYCFETSIEELNAAKAWQSDKPDSIVLVRTNSLKNIFVKEGVICFTVHEAKGLEWDSVWVAGCEESLFPHILTEVQEERRLFYVAATRAKNRLVFSSVASRSSAKNKTTTRTKSRFVKEAFEQPQDLIEDDLLG